MTVVTIAGIVPNPRYDHKPWTLAIMEESVNGVDGWSEIERFNLSPLDEDPTSPQPRSFTTEEAVEVAGNYRFIFTDSDGDELQMSDVYYNGLDPEDPYLPPVNSTALLLRARTKDNHGNELGYWSSDTRPTYADVDQMIHDAADEILAAYDRIPSGEAIAAARRAVALRTAMDIEASFFPEQVGTARSAYDSLETRFNVAFTNLTYAVERGEPVDEGGVGRTANMPVYTFPEDAGGMVGWGTIW